MEILSSLKENIMPHNLKSKEEATARASNFERRLKETMNTETDPEMYTGNTAGAEELPYNEKFPLIDIFNESNMKPGGKRVRDGQRGLGRDNE
jgi:hypothetical protein